MEPADPGDGTAAVSVVVTAVLADGFEWGQLGGWVRVDATTATLTLELVGASCEDVTPAAPELTQAVCADGVLSEPSLVLAETDDVTYTVEPEGPYVPGDVVTVTATLAAAGVGWGEERPGGWVFVDDVTATLEVTFDDVGCIPVGPGVPGVVAATCTGGVVVPPTVTLPTGPTGVTYSMEPADPGDGTAASVGDGDGGAGGRVRVGSARWVGAG